MPQARDANNKLMPIPGFGAPQVVAIGAASAQSAAVNAPAVRLVATVDCWVLHGANPTATTSSILLGPYADLYISLDDPSHKVAVIQGASGAGSLSVVPVL